MSPTKLEVKSQLDKLEYRGFIKMNTSPWGALMLLTGKKDGDKRLCMI